jgi:error-prone DNA polymerase
MTRDLPGREITPPARLQVEPARRKPRAAKSPPYAELHAASAFSFLTGASLPEDLAAQAAALEISTVALVDRNGVYGAPRFYRAAKQAGLKAIVGAEVALAKNDLTALGIEPPDPKDPMNGELPRLTLLVANRTGYRNLCRLLTRAACDHPKGEAQASWEMLAEHAAGLHCITGGAEGPLAHALTHADVTTADRLLDRLAALFPGALHVELQRHRRREEERRNQALLALAHRRRLPLLATNGVRYASRTDKPLHDVFACIRGHTTLDAARGALDAQSERHLKGAAEMAALFADFPAAVAESAALAERLDFTLADLGYRFPDFPLPPGETPSSYLRQLTWKEADERFLPLDRRTRAQLEKELALIEKLDLAGYFLIVREIVDYCRQQGILVQGRGSAANSAVCYALRITAVDPVKMDLLFERFLSEERGEWPDIDLDLPSGEQREKVIQHVYQLYGPHGAGMTANVNTYRTRSAAREVAKALGYSPEQVDKLAKHLSVWRHDLGLEEQQWLESVLKDAGFDPAAPRVRILGKLWRRIQNLPRHLSQHSGGMVIAKGRLDEVVPIERATMKDRWVVQWDKDDCADLGIVKVDLLGLGILQAMEEMIPLIRTHEGKTVDLAHLPPDDEKVYAMIRAADTVGVFQIESRAQMASLPRNAPETFYDLVIQVAIIRPGPITGGMLQPFFERRRGREEPTYLHPKLEPVLKRTLGVPIFQEQILKMAIVAADFTGGEAEELRRAMGFKRSVERMQEIERRLRDGMTKNEIVGEAQEQIVRSITAFALYGFPESHAASFALLAYASAWLRAYHPTAFYVALLNAWPMGFYHPATLVKDAERHGVESRPVDVNASGWSCRWESSPPPKGEEAGALRLGMRYVRGLRKLAGEAIEREQARAPFRSVDDLARRCRLRADELATLAEIGAFSSLGLSRRTALWQAARAARPAGELFEGMAAEDAGAELASPLPEMLPHEETAADYAGAQLTTGPHPMTYVREILRRQRVLATAELAPALHGRRVRTAGSIIVRQRPGTGNGVVYLALEDETGTVQASVDPELMHRCYRTIVDSPGLVVEGVLQHRDGAVLLRAERFWPLPELSSAPSHDFR